MQVKLDPRLEKIANLVKINSRVADIGTDHGYIAIYLIQTNISPFVIAGDVNLKPLETARKNIQAMGLESRIETRLGSGLTILRPHEVDTIIIAGMGGVLISQILEQSPEVVDATKELILQPMQAQEDLRRYLVGQGYRITKDVLIKEDHRIYEIICAEEGKQQVSSDIQFEIGFHIEENPRELAIEFIEGKINVVNNIIEDIKDIKVEPIREKLRQCTEKLIHLQEVLSWLKK